MHAGNQDLLVVGAVEDTDHPPLGQHLAGAPEEVVAELLGGRLLERLHLATLGIDTRHHVPDGPVLAGSIHGLEHDQEGVGVVGPEQSLCLRQFDDEFVEVLLGHLLVPLLV